MPLKMYTHPLDHVENVIGVLGGKGGVGKSTVAVNVALALQAKGRKVGLLDADVYGPSIKHLLGNEGQPIKKGEFITPAKAKGLSFISMAFFGNGENASVVRAPIANQMIQQFLGRIDWGTLDDLVIDFPPGTGDVQITLMQQARLTGVLVVTTPQEVALLDVRKSVQMCNEMQVPILGIIENMSYILHQNERITPFGEGGGKQLADATGCALIGQIPLDPKISQLGDEGRSIFEANLLVAKQFEEVANRTLSSLRQLKLEKITVYVSDDKTRIEMKENKKVVSLSANQIQKTCPCIRCLEKREKGEIFALSPVVINEVSQVGDFGVKIVFSKGCSQGIYPFTHLIALGNAS